MRVSVRVSMRVSAPCVESPTMPKCTSPRSARGQMGSKMARVPCGVGHACVKGCRAGQGRAAAREDSYEADKVPFRLAARTFQLGRRMSSSQKGCGTSVTSSKPVAIGSTSGLESTEAAASIDGGWATRLTRGRVRCGEVRPRITLVEEKLLLGMKAAACASNSSMVRRVPSGKLLLTG